MDTIEELKARLVELHKTSKAVQDKADGEKRDLTTDETKEIEMISEEFDQVEADIARRERIAAQGDRLSASSGRVVPAEVQNAGKQPEKKGTAYTRLPTLEERAQWGFKGMGDFCNAVKDAACNPGAVDQRLIANAATTYGSEGVGADGGFAVPPEWRTEIMAVVLDEEELLARTDKNPVSGNTMTFPVDETTSYQTSGGIQAYWDGEASAITQSKPLLKELTAKLSRLTAMVPMTDELLEDAPAMGAYVQRKAGEKLSFKVTDAIVNGTGVGMPLGIMNSPCLVTVSKIGSQVADTFHAKNVVAMMGRMPARNFRNAVWLINQDLITQIPALGFPVTDGTTTNVGSGALYTAPGAMAGGSPYGLLWGRPIVATEACAPIGDLGDVILADMSQYLTVIKSSGIKADTSIHLFFDTNTTAFRFVMRMNGQPWLSTAIARKSGSNTLSHFVTLEAR